MSVCVKSSCGLR